MALIVCPECGNKVSEYAVSCPSCGCPIDKIKELIERDNEKKKTLKFIQTRTQEEINLIEKFQCEIAKVYSPFLKASCKSIYYFAIGNFYNPKVLSWFCKNSSNELILKYYSYKNGVKETKIAKIDINNFNDVLEEVKDEYTYYLNKDKQNNLLTKPQSQNCQKTPETNFSNHISVKEAPVVNDSLSENISIQEINKTEQNLKLSPRNSVIADISNAYHGNKTDDPFIRELADKLLENRKNRIKNLEIEIENFKNKKSYEFDREISFDILVEELDCLKQKEPCFEYFYDNYRIDSVIKVIREYEGVFNVQIITDIMSFRKELLEIIQNWKKSISQCEHLTSSIKLIPDSKIDGLLEYFKEQEDKREQK